MPALKAMLECWNACRPVLVWNTVGIGIATGMPGMLMECLECQGMPECQECRYLMM